MTGVSEMTEQVLVLDRISGIAKGEFTFSQRVDYLKQYGIHSQAFSTLQPGMKYFDMPGIGYIAYMTKWGKAFVLGDPVADPANFELILTEFHKKHSSANFIQVTKPIADILNRRFNYFGTQFGSESKIDLVNWDLKGKKKQILRTALNQSEQAGITVKERFSDDHTREISEAWIKTRKCKSNEIRFLIRPMVMNYKENERHFYAYQDGKAVGFIYFDPIYDKNKIVSYVPNISRACAEFKQGIFYTLMCHAMAVFKAEGIPYIDLGLIPLSLSEEMEPQESRPLKRIFKLVYEKGNFLYNFKGLEFTKSRFRGDMEKTYVCHKNPLPMIDFLSVFKLTRVI